MYTVYRFLFESDGMTQFFIDKIEKYDGILKCFKHPTSKETNKICKSIVSIVVSGSRATNDVDENLRNLIFSEASEYDGIPFGSSVYPDTSLEDGFVKKYVVKNIR